MPTFLANALWIALSAPESIRWRLSTRAVEKTQRATLTRILRAGAAANYASRITHYPSPSIPEFQQTFPLTTYADLAPWIERIAAGEENVLTAQPVSLLEPTSGSTAAGKLIPYTPALKDEFQRGIAPWVTHSFLHHPALFGGQAYWSVTPVTARNRRSVGGVPIGFEDESEYFGGVESRLINAVMAVPSAVKLIADMDSFRYVTLLFLLRSRRLALISVWNPTFLTLLIQPLTVHGERLAADIAAGTLTPPAPLDADLLRLLTMHNRPDPARGDEIRHILTTAKTAAERHRRLWPRLRLISCWADANAARYAEQLHALFPQAALQPKGLLATEGFVSFPLDGQPGAALSLRSHFFEFLPVHEDQTDLTATPKLAHELDLHARYAVVITTGGGLYRYQLGDIVEVTGFFNRCPLIRLIGRAGAVSDWFGEKLHEAHVRRVLEDVLTERGLAPSFAMLACDDALPQPVYVLYLEDAHTDDAALSTLAADVERRLCENVHYAYCRDLGQLAALRVFRVRGGALDAFIRSCVAHGQRAGDVKPVALHRRSGWSQIFSGEFLVA
ncbi:MAG: GH3 auxin-responsive promoter family protein [Caldilineaceae bacterium]